MFVKHCKQHERSTKKNKNKMRKPEGEKRENIYKYCRVLEQNHGSRALHGIKIGSISLKEKAFTNKKNDKLSFLLIIETSS